jgi:hypothetical protein
MYLPLQSTPLFVGLISTVAKSSKNWLSEARTNRGTLQRAGSSPGSTAVVGRC